jgi:hypothetical protein
MLYTAKAHRFTARFWRKRLVSLRLFAKNAQYDPKTCSYEDNAYCHCSFLARALSYVMRFRRKQGMNLGEFEKDFRKMLGILCLTSIND